MRTFYSSTKPGWYDTKAIAKDKWLQVVNGDAVSGSGLVASPGNILPAPADGKVRTVQKILKKLQP